MLGSKNKLLCVNKRFHLFQIVWFNPGLTLVLVRFRVQVRVRFRLGIYFGIINMEIEPKYRIVILLVYYMHKKIWVICIQSFLSTTFGHSIGNEQ